MRRHGSWSNQRMAVLICQRPSKVIAKKGKHNVGQLTSDENGKNVTVVCSVLCRRCWFYPRTRMKPSLMDNGPAGAVAEANKSGWITEAIFTKWFQHLITMVQPQSRLEPVVFLMDGHRSHTGNLDVVELASSHNVILIVLPSHCSQWI